MKAGREHRVPLSAEAVEILKARREAMLGDLVFPGWKGGKPLAGSERTETPNEVTEMAQAHAIEDKAEAAYRRGELMTKRALLMHRWATFATTPRLRLTSCSSAPRSIRATQLRGENYGPCIWRLDARCIDPDTRMEGDRGVANRAVAAFVICDGLRPSTPAPAEAKSPGIGNILQWGASVGTTPRPPKWIKPQLTRLVDEAPAGGGWLHEITRCGQAPYGRRVTAAGLATPRPEPSASVVSMA
jgi:hypothetical protein